MFRFLELSLHGWDLWPPIRVPLERDVVLVSGPNGSGKTTLLDAVRQLLNAQLSSKRRLQHYLRRPDAPALLRAVVSNDAVDGCTQPFRTERIATDVATLACALVPASGGAPEKRFAILPGRAPIEEVRERLLSPRGWFGPEQYSRALENAGVTRSLMSILATEQGRTNALFEVKPRELFQKVIEMLGERQILERYREARRKYETARVEVDRQSGALVARQNELLRVQRLVAQLDAYEEAGEKVTNLKETVPAAELQGLTRRHDETSRKLPELRTKLRNAETAHRELAAAKEAAELALQRAAENVASAAKGEKAATDMFEEAVKNESLAAKGLKDLEEKVEQLARRTPGDLQQLKVAVEQATRAHVEAQQERERLALQHAKLEERIVRLRAGAPVFPTEVEEATAALSSLGIAFVTLADTVDTRDADVADAVEAALGDARFGLIVAPGDEQAALDAARARRFPGPIYGGARIDAATSVGPLQLGPGAPAWLERWLSRVTLKSDGTWSDERGTWVGGPDGHVLGKRGRRLALESAERQMERLNAEIKRAAGLLTDAAQALDAASTALRDEEDRLVIAASVSLLPEARECAIAARTVLQQAKSGLENARRRHLDAQRAESDARSALEKNTNALADLNVEGHRSALHNAETEVADARRRADELALGVRADLRTRAERGELDSADTVRSDLERAERVLAALPSPPTPEIREEAKHLHANVEELERHLAERRKEADAANAELGACRSRYLDVVSSTMHDYRHRAIEIAARADVHVEMEIPRLTDDDRSLDEAAIRAEFGFDGKDPLPLGDPSFSGGQQVIAGLILLMAMAETDRRGFFILDEPFAHLSLDRIDQVGRFLRSTRSQFIITAPTTLDRAQLDPASAVIVLRKKRSDDAHAPVPIVAEA